MVSFLQLQLGRDLVRLTFDRFLSGRIGAAIDRRAGKPFRILNTSRPPISVQARPQFDRYGKPQAQVQSVRLFRSYVSRRLVDVFSRETMETNSHARQFLLSMLTTFAMYGVLHWYVFAPLNDLIEEDEDDEATRVLNASRVNGSAETKPEEEMEVVDLIPFPMTTQLVQPGPYRRSDPEYIQYMKMQGDKALIKQLIADAPNWAASQIPQHGYAYQALKLKPWRSWIDAKFQELPPPFYTQSGLEIGRNFIAWSTFEVEADVVKRQERVLYPVPAAKAMWNFVRVAFTPGDANEKAGMILTEHLTLPTGYKITFDQLAAATPSGQAARKKQVEAARKKAAEFGMRISEPLNKAIETKMNGSAGASSSQQTAETSSSPPLGQTINNDQSNGKPNQSKLDTLKELARKKKAGEWSEEDDEAIKQFMLAIPAVETLVQISKRFKYAHAVMEVTFQRAAKPMVCPPPRGAVKISGLMQMLVPNGWMMFDIECHWDPKTKEFDEHSFKADLIKSNIVRRGMKKPVGGLEPTPATPRQ